MIPKLVDGRVVLELQAADKRYMLKALEVVETIERNMPPGTDANDAAFNAACGLRALLGVEKPKAEPKAE